MAITKSTAIVFAVMVLGPIAMTQLDGTNYSPCARAQEPAKKPNAESAVQELRKERLAIARDLVKQMTQRIKTGMGSVGDLAAPTRLLYEAELELCASNQDRVAVLERYLAATVGIEKLAIQYHQSGVGPESTALAAKLERLRVEIALVQAKNAQGALPKGGDRNVPGKIDPGKAHSERIISQPGSIEAFESVRVFARVPGYLKTQNVDIGDRVKRGQRLAVLDVPELETQVQCDAASAAQALARTAQAKAQLDGARAESEAAKLAVIQAQATVRSAAASVQFRLKQFERMKSLFAVKSIDERLLEETKERYQAALETEESAKAALALGKAQAVVSEIKIEQAKGNVHIREAGIKVAQARLEQSRQQLSFAAVAAPFDGVITQRGYVVGDFIRADPGTPLLTVQRTDVVRVIVMVPEREAPRINVGQEAQMEIDALPGKKWSMKVSRIGFALDPQTRLMRVELDLPNPNGQILAGMYGKVNIDLGK